MGRMRKGGASDPGKAIALAAWLVLASGCASIAPAPPTSVILVGLPDEGIIRRYVNAMPWQVREQMEVGLTRDQARRMVVYEGMTREEVGRLWASRAGKDGSLIFTIADQRALLGEVGYADMLGLKTLKRNHRLSELGGKANAEALPPVEGDVTYHQIVLN